MKALTLKTAAKALLLVTCLCSAGTAKGVRIFLRAAVITNTMPDGSEVVMWGYAQDSAFGARDGAVTVPGPMIFVPHNDTSLTIHLDNDLPVATSIIINGQTATMVPVRNPDGRVRSFTHETPPGNTSPVNYVWNNPKPGTHLYQSGTHVQVQVQMGLYGAMKKDAAANRAYAGLRYDNDVTVIFSEIDPALHAAVAMNDYGPGQSMTSTINYDPRYFLINGMGHTNGQAPLFAGNPGSTILLRLLNAGLETKVPMIHGMYLNVIAEDGILCPYPKEQLAVHLPPAKTVDILLPPMGTTNLALFDRRLHLVNDTAPGGQFVYLGINNFPVVPPAKIPLVKLPFNEGAGVNTVNRGSTLPDFTLTSPTPTWAGQNPPNVGGGRSLDFGTAAGNFGVDSATLIPELANLGEFSITGWLNNKSTTTGAGGNRVVTWLAGAAGVELVYQGDGSLRLGINQSASSSPAVSSSGMIDTDPAAGGGNWRFFAVTYDPAAGEVMFYFGDRDVDATRDVIQGYSRGVVGTGVGTMTVGHLNPPGRASATDRIFRGLIDEVHVYDCALLLNEIVGIQRFNGKPLPPPPAPMNLVAMPGNGLVALNWNAAPTATSYNVKRSTTGGIFFANIATGVTNTNYVDMTVVNGTTYFYVVSSVNKAGESVTNSLEVTATPALPIPATPTGLVATPGDSVVNLSWNAAADAANYIIKRSTTSGSGHIAIATNGATTTYMDTDVVNGTTYYYVVMASNASGPSGNSTEASATPTAVLPPSAPTGLAATPGNGKVTLNWNAVAGATGYIVKRSTTSGSGYSAIATNGASTTHMDTNVVNGTQYFYVVMAVNVGGPSGNSSEANATPQAAPPCLVKLQFNENGGTTTVNEGTAGGTLSLTTPTPVWSANVPTGVGGASSLDFGPTSGNFVVESAAALPGLGGLTAFTITGWINNRSTTEGGGGNRILSWINNGGDGVDVVFRSNGRIMVGIDQWPDTSPASSSAGKITTDAAAGAANWRFFAVTYDSVAGEVKFYFGTTAADATLDVTQAYSRGPVGTGIGRLAIGNFNSATRPFATLTRMLRGLIDQVCIFDSVMPLADIIAAQRSGTPPPPPGPDLTPPALAITSHGNGDTVATSSITLSGTASDAGRGNNGVSSVTVNGVAATGGTAATAGTANWSRALTLLPGANVVTVVATDNSANFNSVTQSMTINFSTLAPIVKLAFDETTGTTTANAGSAGGSLTLTTPTPTRSANVPVTVGGVRSVDFGTTTGSFVVESPAALTALGGLGSFTITTWVNCRSTTEGPGGNRIVSWINNGGDGVDVVFRSTGAVQVGIDQWPDTSPAVSTAGKITVDAAAGAANWRFVAITYDAATSTVRFYFGSNAADATLDVTKTYSRGAVGTSIGRLAIGHFNSATRSGATANRMFRGLIDQTRVYPGALSLTDIIGVQRGTLP